MSKKDDRYMEATVKNITSLEDYQNRLKRIATSIYEWVNLPKSMNAEYLEDCLYNYGIASLLKTEKYGFINTKCVNDGTVNIYNLPSKFNCYSFDFSEDRLLYTGLKNDSINESNTCILVKNNLDMTPTVCSIQLFAERLANADRTCDVNLNAQKTPLMIVVDDSQRLTMENAYIKYDGNQPIIFGDKNQINSNFIKAIKTDAPYVIDKICEYKKIIWNECLTYLGISNMALEKKERLVTEEASSNNELVNLNLQAGLMTREKACREFNELFGLTGENAISVRVRSDLYNVIKNNMSIVNDYNNNGIPDNKEGLNE